MRQYHRTYEAVYHRTYEAVYHRTYETVSQDIRGSNIGHEAVSQDI